MVVRLHHTGRVARPGNAATISYLFGMVDRVDSMNRTKPVRTLRVVQRGDGLVPAQAQLVELILEDAPSVEVGRRQNPIDQPERCKQSGKPIRSAAGR